MKKGNQILSLTGLALFAASANADVITPTIDVPLTTTTAVGGYEIEKAVDSSGLSGGGTSGNVLTETNSNGTTQWLNGGAAIGSEVVTFDLGGTYDVDSIHLWNWVYTNSTSTVWGVKDVDISFSSDGTGFGSTQTVSFVADPTPGTFEPSVAQTQTFTTQTGVTHIQLNNFTALDSGNRVGFGEIRFGGTGATPIDPVLSQDLVNGDPDLDFGTVVGSAPFSESRTVRFVNDGPTNAIEISTATVSGDAAYSLSGIAINGSGGVSLPQSLAVGDYIEFTVAASLAAPASGVTGNLVIDTDAVDQDQNLPITGTFTALTDPVLSQDLVNGDPDMDFGTVVGSAPFSESRTVRFVNDGPTNAIEISTATVSGDAAYSLSDIAVNGSGGVSLPQSLAVGDYIEFTVAASLAAPVGGLTGNLVIDTDALDQDQDLLISGTYGTTPTPPPVTNEAPAPGKRVRLTTPGSGYAGNPNVYHTLYLPPEWVPGEKYPVIIEYGGNGWTVEANKLGYYQSAGTGYIWVSMPNIDQNSTLGVKSDDFNTTSWWGSEGNALGPIDDAAYAMATVIDIIENYGGDHSSVFVTGFSRGAVACGNIGRWDEPMADIWVVFIPHSHHDSTLGSGDKATRTDRVKGRPTFFTQEVVNQTPVTWLQARGFPVEAYVLADTGHTDEWITDESTPVASSSSMSGHPLVSDVRARMRTWMSEVITNKPGTSSISGVVTDASGAPIAGVRVQSGLTHWTFTDATGAYEMAGLIDGARTVTVSHASHQWSPDTLNVTLAGADLTAQNFGASPVVPFAITGMSWNNDGDLVIDFTGPANGTFQVRKSLDLQVWPFPTTITAQNAPVTTDGSGVGQAIINAADASAPSAFFQLAHPSP